MKYYITKASTTVLLLLGLWLRVTTLWAQCEIEVESSNNYKVHISLNPTQINPASSSCAFGYNYTVSVAYDVSFSGPGVPAAGVWTLQGTVSCATSGQSHFFNLPNNGGTGTSVSANSYYNGTDCNTTTIASMGCDAIALQINGPGISNRTITCNIEPLPITLLNFYAFAEGNEAVKLQWTTSSEKNNAYFSIEHSLDMQQWQTILTKEGAGNTQAIRRYEAQTQHFAPGRINYYRLKQTDFDGQSTQTEAVAVSMERMPVVVSVYPNPMREQITIDLGRTYTQPVKAKLTDMQGQVIREWVLEEAQTTKPVGDLRSGVYLLSIYTPEGWEHIKLLKV
ncbi:T9SS type A sorting domain-containing protein [Eisenibacter elegans]|uniref:T9SS type A sorting domain-containing protein n=1 Tax=Eisenibacter elegans TaxID=997 RepID=UPI0003FF3003|nr:T9SS type A sorting domain-containing protein [Eisenibacter elegans]